MTHIEGIASGEKELAVVDGEDCSVIAGSVLGCLVPVIGLNRFVFFAIIKTLIITFNATNSSYLSENFGRFGCGIRIK